MRCEDHFEMREYNIDVLKDEGDSSLCSKGRPYPIYPSKKGLTPDLLRDIISRSVFLKLGLIGKLIRSGLRLLFHYPFLLLFLVLVPLSLSWFTFSSCQIKMFTCHATKTRPCLPCTMATVSKLIISPFSIKFAHRVQVCISLSLQVKYSLLVILNCKPLCLSTNNGSKQF